MSDWSHEAGDRACMRCAGSVTAHRPGCIMLRITGPLNFPPKDTMTAPETKKIGTSQQITMRRFLLVRDEDVSGTSGTGVVAEGVEFSNGQVAIHWISQLESVNIYANAKVLGALHGHEGRTRVQWVDE